MRHSVFAVLLASLVVGRSQAQTFNVGANFQTATLADTGAIPPDTQGAVGQNHVVILDNGRYRSFSKLGTVSQNLSDAQFFANAGYSGSGGYGVFGDPRIQFDPLTGRWYALNFTHSPENGQFNNRLVLAVSADANPTGQWKSTVIQTSANAFADFPTMAIDKNGIYIGTNNFGSQFSVSLFSATKTGLLWTGAGTPTLTNFVANQGLDENNFGTSPQASNNFDVNQSGTTNRVVAGYNSSNLRTYNFQNTNGSATLGTASFVGVNTMNDPADAQQPSGNLISTGDNRIGAAVVQMGNKVYAVNSFDNGSGRSQVRFTVLDATTGALIQQGNISSPTLSYYFPSIAVNELGQAVIGFTGSGSSQFATSFAAVSTSSGTLNFGTPQAVLTTGIGNYANGSPSYRWGDYSAVAVDPADTGIFWSFQEVSTTTLNRYATQATEIIPTIANEVRWRNAANGDYASAANWFNNALPTANDHVIYSRNGAAYTVTMPIGVAANNRISVRQGTTTFNIAAGSTYQATSLGSAAPSFAVSQYLGETTLNVTGGGTLSTVYSTLAAGENGLTTNNISKATVNVNGATWSNSRDVYFGGNATRSGGQAQVNISNGGTVTIGEVARFWTSNSGVDLNGGTTVNFNVGGLRADSGVAPTINGSGFGTGATLTITDGLGQNYFGSINGNLRVVKNGAGTQTLSGSMNFSGTTVINAGRLNIDGVKSGIGTISVNNGGALGGSGTVSGLVILGSSSVIAPGSSPGNLTLKSGINMTGGTYEWELAALTEAGPGVNYDMLTLDGGASVIASSAQVELQFLNGIDPNAANPFWNSEHQWKIVDLISGSLSGTFGGVANPSFATGSFFLSGGNGADVFLNFAPVPEPSSIAFVGASLLTLAVWRRRKSRFADKNQ